MARIERVGFGRVVEGVSGLSGVAPEDVKRVLKGLASFVLDATSFGIGVPLADLGSFRPAWTGAKRLNGVIHGPYRTLHFSAKTKVRDRMTEAEKRWVRPR